MRAEEAGDEKRRVGPYLVDNEQVIRQPAGEQRSLLMMVNGVSPRRLEGKAKRVGAKSSYCNSTQRIRDPSLCFQRVLSFFFF